MSLREIVALNAGRIRDTTGEDDGWAPGGSMGGRQITAEDFDEDGNFRQR